ncbi:pirin family protein [Falsarthrobacter nasiphocae]|uniref:Redox-sensitive bicupin YhaK (Pirin superfamily) n=1 Tax=Falsarthrobacter nasiphocae TaxID=189863 RepID=A0AAE4C5W2_9MICC|nr:pirin family protein [Falsarthrobacter nasiphocae]MDR6891908.1 redox-sensitive bicupin YhaK (pirin superfamily) [Falsarthrobacter nasiphocae]
MSNLEKDPEPRRCSPLHSGGGHVTVLDPREVPLGGLRAMSVRRTLPARGRSLVGPWCFLDHYGPNSVESTGGMRVPAHPHTGLQTASWLFSGGIDHADSSGGTARVAPGELDLMTAGRGINHSEFSAPGTSVLHGAQLWIALPDHARFAEPRLESYTPEPVRTGGATVRVFLGEILGVASPVEAFSPIVGAEILLDPGSRVNIPVRESFEHAILLDDGAADLRVAPSPAGPLGPVTAVSRAQLAVVGSGATELEVTNTGEGTLRILLIGGEPFGEEILMWWNFVGREDAEIRAWRSEWQDALEGRETRFGELVSGEPIPAPELPAVRLRTRGNRPADPAPRTQGEATS